MKNLRKEISEILVRWNMPTRQPAITQIMQAFEKECQNQKKESLSITKMKRIKYIGSLCCLIGLLLLWWVDWRIALGVIIFGTGMNIENKYR